MACSDSGTAPAPVAAVELAGVPAGPLLVGTAIKLTPIVLDADRQPVSHVVTWVSSNHGVAIVSAEGVITGVGPGEVIVTASTGQRSAQAALEFRVGGTVGPSGGTLTLFKNMLTLVVPSGSLNAATLLLARAGAASPIDTRVVNNLAFEIGDDSLEFSTPATLTLRWERDLLGPTPEGYESGYVIGVLRNGIWTTVPESVVDTANARVTAPISSGGHYAVLAASADRVVISGAPLSGTLFLGRSVQLTAEVFDAHGTALTGRVVSWTSSAPDVVFVTTTGVVQARSSGAAEIRAQVEAASAHVTLTAIPVPAKSIVISPVDTAVYVGAQFSFKTLIQDSIGGVLTGRPVSWTVSAPAAVVDSTGTLRATTAGDVTVTASVDGRTATSHIVVIDHVTANLSALGEWTGYQGSERHDGYVPATFDVREFASRWSATPFTSASLRAVTPVGDRIAVTTNGTFGVQSVGVLNAASGQKQWEYSFGDVQVGAPALADGVVIVQTTGASGSFLWGFDAASGAIRYRTPFAPAGSLGFPPVVSEGAVYVPGGNPSRISAFTTADGSNRWNTPLAGYAGFIPAVANGSVYAFSGNAPGRLSALDASSGASRFEIVEQTYAPPASWINMSPSIGAQGDVFATQFGRLVAFDVVNQRTRFTLYEDFQGNVIIANGVIYVRNGQAVDARSEADGSLLWRWSPPDGAAANPALVTDNLLFVVTAFRTYAIDLAAHRPVWTVDAIGPLAIGRNGTLYIAMNGTLNAIALH